MSHDTVQTLRQLAEHGRVAKGCALGVIVDATAAYWDEVHGWFMSKLKVVDATLNLHTVTAHHSHHICTVMFFSTKVENLPVPRALGDLVYLRRFNFDHFNNQFQAKAYQTQYCSWYLLPQQGDDLTSYQSSRPEPLDVLKNNDLPLPLAALRRFAKTYLQQISLALTHPLGSNPSDSDFVVLVQKISADGFRLLTKDNRVFLLPQRPSNAKVNDICKLRSVLRLEPQGSDFRVVPNDFTSLTPIPEWSCDAVHFRTLLASPTAKETHTPLHELLHLPLLQVVNRRYRVICEVGSVTAGTFASALKHYDRSEHKVYDHAKKGTQPIYKFGLLLTDESLDSSSFVEATVFSHDGVGSDFLPQVGLQYLHLSSGEEEEQLFRDRCEELLNRPNVELVVEVLTDGKNNRALRIISVS